MAPPRNPPDDPGEPADYDEYIRHVVREEATALRSLLDTSNGRMTNWLLAIMGVLMTTGIIGGVNLYAKVESIDNTMQLLLAGKIVIVQPSK